MWLREKPKYCLCNSTESHNMRTLCQSILWSCLIRLLVTFSTAYFSLLIEITEQYTYFHPNSFLIAIGIAPWSLPGWYHYIAPYRFSHLHEEDRSHIESQKHFSNWNATWYIWVGKTLYIVDSSIIYMYNIDNTQTIILKIPWFHTPAYIFFTKWAWHNGKDCRVKTGNDELIPYFWWQFFFSSLAWHTYQI